MGAEKKRPEAEEIEITPEMIEAGLAEMPGLWSPCEDAEAAVIKIYHAMAKAAENIAVDCDVCNATPNPPHA